MTVEEISSFALSLPETDEVEHWGKPSFRIRNKIFAVIQPDGVSLVIKTTVDDRIAYTTMDPDVFNIPPTFSNMNYMIVRIDLVSADELKGLIVKAWSIVAPKRLVKSFESPFNH